MAAEEPRQGPELWVGFYKTSSGKGGISYSQALDEALCFGWIDGIRKSIDDLAYTIRFTPRGPRSNWSRVNVKRVMELSRLGLMQPSGLEAFEARGDRVSDYSYEESMRKLGPTYEKRFRRNRQAWSFFQSQSPSYQRSASWWVMSAKREETRKKRLDTLIEDSENERRLAMLARPAKSKAE